MVGWHHQHNGHEFEQAPGVGDGQRGLVYSGYYGYNPYYYGYNYSYDSSNTVTVTTTSTEIPSFAPLIFQVYVEKYD